MSGKAKDKGTFRYVVSSMPPDVIEPTGEMRIGNENEEDVRVASTSNLRTDDDDSNNDSKIPRSTRAPLG